MSISQLVINIYKFINPSHQESFETGDDIYLLSTDILSPQEIEKVDLLTNDIVSGRLRKRQAIKFLRQVLGVRPKRPIYYITLQFLPRLPHYTRDTMRYLGDYIDGLVKYTSSEILSNNRHLNKSLGSNLVSLKGRLEDGLIESLVRYNNVIYVPAKHDFKVGKRLHRFTCKEVVLACIITKNLADELKNISPFAKQFADDELPQEYW